MALSRPTKPSIPSQDVKLVTIGMPCGYAQRMVLAGLMNEVRRVRHLLKGPQVAVSTRCESVSSYSALLATLSVRLYRNAYWRVKLPGVRHSTAAQET